MKVEFCPSLSFLSKHITLVPYKDMQRIDFTTLKKLFVLLTGITWTEQYIKVTGITGSVFMVAGAGGEMVGPLVIGLLFDKLGPKSFLYVLFITILILVALFTIMQCFAGRHGMIREKSSDVEETDLRENGTSDCLVMQETDNDSTRA